MHAPPQRAASNSRSQSRVPESQLDAHAIVASLVNFATPKRSIDASRSVEVDAPTHRAGVLGELCVSSVTPLRSRNAEAKVQQQVFDKSAAASVLIKPASQSQDGVILSKKSFTPKSADKVNNASKALEEDVFAAAVKLGFKNNDIQRMPRTADELNVIFNFAFSKALPGNTGTLVQKLRLLNLHHLASDDLLTKRDKAVRKCGLSLPLYKTVTLRTGAGSSSNN
jgi:hypothetical protein